MRRDWLARPLNGSPRRSALRAGWPRLPRERPSRHDLLLETEEDRLVREAAGRQADEECPARGAAEAAARKAELERLAAEEASEECLAREAFERQESFCG